MNRQGIITLGMHRSGTSLVAKLIAGWGAAGKEGSMIGADASNPEGHWEYAPLVSFNNELLNAVDSRWNVPPSDGHRELLGALAQEADFRRRATELLQEMRTDGRPWFWKDPRLSILLPFWKQFWGSVVYVVATRDPSDIAVSLKSRDGLSKLTSFLLWERYLSEIMRDEEIRQASYFVSYELLMKQPYEESNRLCRFLDQQFEIQRSHPDVRPETMAAAVAPRLWRSHARPFLDHPLATLAQRTLYHATLHHPNDLIQEGLVTPRLQADWRDHLVLADHRLQRERPDLCQVFWRNSDCVYEERRSTTASIKAQRELQSIQLVLPSGQVQDKILLRVDFSQRPGFLQLMEISVTKPTGEIVWSWDGRFESIQDLPRNQTESYGEPAPQRGCLLRFDGNDPWIEIALDASQSAALANGGTLLVRGTYLSTERAFSTLRAEIAAEIGTLRRKLDRLRERYMPRKNRTLHRLPSHPQETGHRRQRTAPGLRD